MTTSRPTALRFVGRRAALAVVVLVTAAAFGTAGGAVPARAASVPARAASVPARASGGDATVTGALASFYRPPDPLRREPPGTIVRSQRLAASPGLPPGTRSYRILFRTTSSSGGDLAESGVAVVPGGAPPPGGFPIVSWAHGTTGVASGCAPSVQGTASLPDLPALIAARDIVVAADYRGLGAPGADPYLVGDSEAEDVLDAARAARSLVGTAASNSVVVLGYSQGGQAALFAGEIAPTYAPDLYLAGVAAVAPVTSVLELAPTGDQPPPSGQSAFTAMALFAWARHYRTFVLSSVLTPAGLADLTAVSTTCVDGVAALYDAVSPTRFFLPGWEHEPAVQAANRANLPGAAPTPAPILVVQGTADEVVPYATTSSFVAHRLCRDQYDTVQYVVVPGAGHTQAMGMAQPAINQWIQDRLAGDAADDSCAQPNLGLETVG